MGCFYLSWMIVSAAAVHVLCQDVELTTSLPEGNDACIRNEVNFTCTIRGSANLTRLILAWSSREYIGNTLQFTTADDPGEIMITTVNENVTAVLKNKTMIDGVPVLVSELRIVSANQNSTITCDSETSSHQSSTDYIVPVFPNSPRNGVARQVSQDCNLSLTWNPPANTDLIGLTYRIYVPARNISISNVSNVNHEFNVINCRDDDIRVLIAAVNRFGCEGPSSSKIQPILLEIPTVTVREAQLGPGAIAGIVVAVVVVLLLVVGVMLPVVGGAKADIKRKQEKEQLWIESYCVKVFDGLRWGVRPSKLVQKSVLRETSAKDVQEGLINFIDTKLTSATRISFVLHRLKRMGLSVMSEFDTELKSAGSSVTMDKLIEEANKGKPRELTRELKAHLEELTKKLRQADPERVKELLKKFFEDLKNVKGKKDELLVVEENLWKMEEKAEESSANSVQEYLLKVIQMLRDENFLKEWDNVIKPSSQPPHGNSKKQ